MIADLRSVDIKSLLNYDPETGIWKWICTARGRRKDLVAGCYDRGGYLLIRINYSLYKAHRLAFLYMNGSWPEGIVDHLDRNTSNNKWENLVEANHSVNAINTGLNRNNTSGFNGIWYDKSRAKWCAEIKINYNKKHLGRFDNIDDAIEARSKAEIIYHSRESKDLTENTS